MNNKKQPAILVTGATGSIGRELTQQLAAKNIPFRALIRKSEDAQLLPAGDGVEWAIGDLADTGSILRAAAGIERAFLLTNSSEEAEALQGNFVDSAQQAGVQHVVKQSQWAASPASPVRFLRYHAAVEDRLRQSGMAYTFLRPNLFMQGLLSFQEPIKHQNKFFAAVGDAKISLVDTRDIAAVAVAALTGEGHENKTYNLTGPAALTHAELAARLSLAVGREIRFVDVSPDEMRHTLLAVGFPPWQAEGLIEDYAHYARGEAAAVIPDIQQVTGKPARRFEAFATDYAKAFM